MDGDLDQLSEAGRDHEGSFVLENPWLLKASLHSGALKARLGSMVAYQGELAFESGIDWDIQRVRKGLAGKVAGGLFNTHLSGTGWVALVSDGKPVLLWPSEAPTFADPQSAIAWSGTLETSFKTDFQLRTFIGLGSGESVQIGFQGEGWVLVQPSEGRRKASAGGGGGLADLFSAAGG